MSTQIKIELVDTRSRIYRLTPEELTKAGLPTSAEELSDFDTDLLLQKLEADNVLPDDDQVTDRYAYVDNDGD